MTHQDLLNSITVLSISIDSLVRAGQKNAVKVATKKLIKLVAKINSK